MVLGDNDLAALTIVVHRRHRIRIKVCAFNSFIMTAVARVHALTEMSDIISLCIAIIRILLLL